MPSYNSRRWLADQLAALSAQDYGGELEVIVADNGSGDGSDRLAREWVLRHPAARLVDASAQRGPGAARNAGARAANGDFLAFCDADDVVSRSWVRELVATAADADVVGGRFESARLNPFPATSYYELGVPDKPHLGFLPHASGANIGIWREVFDALGGFSEHSLSEDVALTWDAQLRGYTFKASDALVHKRLPQDLRDAARRFFAYGRNDAWLYRCFRAAGMPRRSRQETLTLYRVLLRGFPGVPEHKRRALWVIVLALSTGRLVGSARWRVLFT